MTKQKQPSYSLTHGKQYLIKGLESNIAEVRQIVLSRVFEVLTAGKAPEAALAEAQKSLEELAARV